MGRERHGESEVSCPKNPLTHKSDWHLISPYCITPESNVKVMRIKELITYKKKLLIFRQILLISTLEMFREQYGEYGY